MKHAAPLSLAVAGLVCLAVGSYPANGQGASKAIPVRLEQRDGQWHFLRDGKPYFVRGAGGSGPLSKLKAVGGNSIRTWGIEGLDKILDEALKLDITVCVGIWLGHERHGFSYNDADQVAAQVAAVREAVLKYKDHPAVLLWALGNEMEGYENGDNAAMWSHVNSLAAMVHRLDPNHPTMTVNAEIGGDRVKNLNRLCPEIDVYGINSYAGAPSIPERYTKAGGTKPYLLTEYGASGSWEVAKKAWGAPVEPTSTEKAAALRSAYAGAIADKPLALGGYAFTWGHKQEATSTWFGLLLPDGSRVGAVDALTELWSGKAPANRCPVVQPLALSGADTVDPDTTVDVKLTASDPDGDPLKVEWALLPEADRIALGGDSEAALPSIPDAILESRGDGAKVRLPKDPGGYRLFVVVRDDHGGAATANLPFLVKGEVKLALGRSAKLPLSVYAEKSESGAAYVPTGWMGNLKSVKVDEGWEENPASGKTCLKCSYNAADQWAGVVWQSPAGDWGEKPGGWNLAGAKKLVFKARGEKGGETLGFQFGLLGKDKRYFDTASGKLDGVKLSSDWREYTLDLAGKDLTRIKTGFCWVAAGQGAPVTFYLDDIRYE